MHGWAQDLRYSFRQLVKMPSFTITAILSLALGIGATTAVFSVVYGVLLNPYPYKNPDRLVHLFMRDKGGEKVWPNLTGSQFQQLRQTPIVESAAGWENWNLSTTGGDIPEDVSTTYFTSNAFEHFGGGPMLLGRPITPADAKDGQDPEPVAVLGYLFWHRHYNGDKNVLGKTIQLSHKNYLIVGVAPQRFTWNDADVYVPIRLTNDQNRVLSVSARLKPGVSFAVANAQFQPMMQQFAKENPARFPQDFRMQIEGLNDQFVERIGGTLFLLFAAVVLLLAIGCGNVSILLLARGTVRQHELGVRAAIGASRARLIRQLLTEASVLAFAGAALGVLIAYQTVNLIAKWLPEFSFPKEASMQINMPVLIFSVAVTFLTAIIFGLSPALEFSRPEVSHLISGSRRTTSGSRAKRTHFALIGAQIAITVLLLTGAGAATRGFLNLMHVNLGYDPANTMSVGIPIHDNTYKTWEERTAYFENLERAVGNTTGVNAVAISTNATPPENGWEMKVDIEGTNSAQQPRARANLVNPGYFSVLKIPLLQGRMWNDTENHNAARVAVINQTMAKLYWPNNDALGRRIRLPELHFEPPFFIGKPGLEDGLEIIGVVSDARNNGLAKDPKPAFYVPFTSAMGMFTQILVRTQGSPLAMLNTVRSQIKSVNADQQAVRDVRSLDEMIVAVQEWQQEHLVANLFAAFSILALILAAVGLYSVVSYTVAQRTNEIGIRMALGALTKDILRLVFTSVASSVFAGLAAGLFFSVALDGVLSRWAQVRSRDPLILASVILLLVLAAGLACLIPARRAAAVDPMKALRWD